MKGFLKKVKIPAIILLIVLCVALAGGETIANAQDIETINYSQKSTYDEKDDGWVYVFEINYPDVENEDRVYMFDGYNLKYKQLDGYYVPVIDNETKEEITRITPEYITLSISEDYKDDIEKIVNYFNEKQFNNKITINDLLGLDIEVVSKEYLVDIFNKTIDSELESNPGQYIDSNFYGKVNVSSTDEEMKGEWQATYLLRYGEIYDINIEFIDENGNYLSDSTSNLDLTEEIEEIEKNIVDTQTIYSNTATRSANSNNISNSDLNNLLQKAQEKILED